MIKIQAHTLFGRKLYSLFIASLILASTSAYSKQKVAIITGSNDLKEESLGSEMYCMAKAFADEYKNEYQVSLLNNKRSIEGTLENIEIIKKSKIGLVIGAANSTESKPLADSSETYKYYTPLATNPSLLDNKNVYLFNSNDTVIANRLAKKINKESGSRVALITNISSSYSKYLTEAIKKKISNEKTIIPYTFIEGNQSAENFKGFIKKNKINILFFPIHASRAAFFYNALKELDGSYTIYGADGIGGRPKFLKSITPTSKMINFYYVKSWNGSVFEKSPFFKKFKQLKEKYCPDKSTSMVMAFMFDTLNYVLNKKIDKNNYFGIAGKHSFSNNVSTRKLFLYQIEKNGNKLLGQF